MKSWLSSLLTPLMIGALIAGCSSSAQVVPDPADKQPATENVSAPNADDTASTESHTVGLNKTSQYGAIRLTVENVTVEYDQIAIAMTVTNLSDELVRFYPNLSTLDLGDRQIEANQFLTDDDISGAFDPGEARNGNLVFTTRQEDPLDLTELTSVDLFLGEVIDMESLDPELVNFTLPLKPSNS